ncbi:DUF2849 domain-containing protein [Sneathiella sp.]|uniref:DUF2849 domain-containing protein n=1 Tax=Sneathiella sp. TaxID=1964365 RepID=UPI00356756F5
MALQIYTASLLKEGQVAYLCLEDGLFSWTSDIQKATTGEGDFLESLKIAAEKSEQDNIVVAPYAIDIIKDGDGWTASTKREQIRATGPTIRLPQDKSRPNTGESRQAA